MKSVRQKTGFVIKGGKFLDTLSNYQLLKKILDQLLSYLLWRTAESGALLFTMHGAHASSLSGCKETSAILTTRLLSRTKVKNECSYAFTPPFVFM